jgi:hypothetical protein
MGILIIAYMALKFALLLLMWVVLGPLALVFQLFGSAVIIDWLDSFIDALDRGAWSIHGGIERALGVTDGWL